MPQLLIAALTDPEIGGFSAEHWNNLLGSVLLGAERIEKALSNGNGSPPGKINLEMIGNVFYRGHGAYFVGRAIRSGAEDEGLPLALCF